MSSQTMNLTPNNGKSGFQIHLDYGSLKHVKRIIGESKGFCYQDISFDCFETPLKFNGINYAWWLDRNGNKQYFLDGAHLNTSVSKEHVCVALPNYL